LDIGVESIESLLPNSPSIRMSVSHCTGIP
jgi:hypothetical protein